MNPRQGPDHRTSSFELADFPLGGAASVALGRKLAFYLVVAASGTVLGLALARLPLLLVVGGLAGMALVTIILVKPYWGLLFYTVIFTLRLGEVYPILGTLHLERVVGVLTLAGLFISQHRREGRTLLDGTRQTRLLMLFLLMVLPSVPFAYWRKAAVDGLIEMMRIVAFYVMIVHLIDTRTRLKAFLWIYCLSMLWLASTSLWSYFSGHAQLSMGVERAVGSTSAGGNANELGATMACSFPLLFLLSTTRALGRKRLLATFGWMLLLLTMAITGSRASLLGFLGGLVALWWISSRRAMFGVLGLGALVLGLSFLPGQYKERYSTITSGKLDGSSMARVQTWKNGLRIVSARPIFGVGIACFGSANAALNGSWLSSHNLYLQALGELGLVGGAVFFMFLAEILRLNRRTRRRLSECESDWDLERTVLGGVFAGLVVLLVAGMFGHSMMRRTWYIFAAVDLVILRLYLQASQAPAGAHPSLKGHQ
jgi:O-antigen ligase